MIRIKMLAALLLLSSAAHAGSVTFDLRNTDYITGTMTLESDNIQGIQTEYSGSTLYGGTSLNYDITLTLDFGLGDIDFEVTGGGFVLEENEYEPGRYTNSAQFFMTEITTNPGQTTNWRLDQFIDSVPGNPYDDVFQLVNLDVGGSAGLYVDNYPSAGHHYWEIQSSVVPVPAAAWLFGSALAGLGWLRRKQTS